MASQNKHQQPSPAPVDPVTKLMREQHRRTHPNCTYGDEPHFVLSPPGEN